MTLLISFPAEIIIKILKLVALKSSQSLRNLCLTSKAFNQISSPWLVYRWTNSKDSPEPSLQCFASHLLKHPELRSKVRIVDFGVLRLVPPTAESSGETYNPELVALAECLRADVEFSSFHGWRDLLEAIKRGCEDAISVAVLAWCKQITHLNMRLPRTDSWLPYKGEWGLTFANEACGRNVEIRQQDGETKGLPLAQLQYVELLPVDLRRTVYFEWVIPFLHHPKVKSLVAWGAEDAKFYWYIERGHYSNRYTVVGEKNVSNVEELMLMRAGHWKQAIAELLSIPRNLKKLTLQPCINCYNHFDMPDYERLAEDIELCRESLEELDLVYSSTRVLVVLLKDPVAKKVYRQCTRLRRLACPMDSLFSDGSDGDGESQIEREVIIDIERLPQTIEYLKPRRRQFVEKWYNNKHGPVKPCIDGFIELLKQAAPDGRLPNLKVLDFTDTFVDDPDTYGIDEMKELAKSQGVELLMAQRQICGRN